MGRILFLSHYSHRNSDCPYSINTFISQCDMDLITNLVAAWVKNHKEVRGHYFSPIQSVCKAFTMHPLLSVHAFFPPLLRCLMAGHNASRILQRFMGYILVNGRLSNSKLEKTPLGRYCVAPMGGCQRLRENKCLLLRPPSLWHAVVPAYTKTVVSAWCLMFEWTLPL